MVAKKILIIDDEVMIRWVLSEALSDWNFAPIQAENIKSALELFDTEQPVLTLLDINLPDGSGLDALQAIKSRQPNAPVVMITAGILIENVTAALRAGACDFITKPINLDKLKAILHSCLEAEEGHRNSRLTQKNESNNFNFEQIIGESKIMKELLSLAQKVAESDVSSILLQGESGTGKDLIAKAIHYSSARAAKPFVAINCAAIPVYLIESELFGHEKGSFTGAVADKKGLFEIADDGTLFLDEIGELDISLQAKILRALQEKQIRRVGGIKDIDVDVRVVAATNRDLLHMVGEKQFREDLYYRLNVLSIELPSLRERRTDIAVLIDYFVKKHTRNTDRKITINSEARRLLEDYAYPGNVRQLESALERAILLCEDDIVTLADFPPEMTQAGSTASGDMFKLPPEGVNFEDVERSLIMQAMDRTDNNITKSAKLLGLTFRTLQYRLEKFGFKKDGESDEGEVTSDN